MFVLLSLKGKVSYYGWHSGIKSNRLCPFSDRKERLRNSAASHYPGRLAPSGSQLMQFIVLCGDGIACSEMEPDQMCRPRLSGQ